MPWNLYADRQEAGEVLAAAVRKAIESRPLAGRPLVLAIPRGGVPVARVVAEAMGADLDIVVPRKIGAEGNPEYAIGSVMYDGTLYLNPEALAMIGAGDEYIEAAKESEMREAARRLKAYRGARPEPAVSGRMVVVVDDGIATGATMIAALRWARAKGAGTVVAAAPVAPASTVDQLKAEADLVVCPHTPEPFYAIGAFYSDFRQVSDREVEEALWDSWERRPTA